MYFVCHDKYKVNFQFQFSVCYMMLAEKKAPQQVSAAMLIPATQLRPGADRSIAVDLHQWIL